MLKLIEEIRVALLIEYRIRNSTAWKREAFSGDHLACLIAKLKSFEGESGESSDQLDAVQRQRLNWFLCFVVPGSRELFLSVS
jgi:hypothetical protein